MKKETKNKLKKIAKVVGFTITFGFAVFGVLCAAMLMANGSGAKDNIKTLGSSLVLNGVRSERNSKPRKADNEEGTYLLEDVGFGGYHINIGDNYFEGGATMDATTYGLNPSSSYTIPYGYYQITSLEGNGFYIFANSSSNSESWQAFVDSYGDRNAPLLNKHSFVGSSNIIINGLGLKHYLYYDGSQQIFFHGSHVSQLKLELVDTLKVPSSSIVKLPNNWAPFSLITDQVTDDNRFGLLNLGSPTSATLVGPDVELTNIIFRYRGVVYDKIHFSFNDASHSTGYVRTDGSVFDPLNQYAVRNVDTHVMSLNYISFGQSWTNRYDKVIGARYSDKALPESPVDGVMWYPALGQYYWVNGGAPTIEIIDLKSETASGRYNNRYANLDDLQLLELLSNYSAQTLDIGDTGMVFDLMTTAFNSLTPILSIYILPGLTLGMILFIPLIGGIIVVIIKVIKK